MPKSDTWPGGIGLEAMTGMESAGSCDSVVSANSGSSDDSLEYLSAEEKACLMFLEETIESLDTEEDSGLSNDEPDQLPGAGSLATKLADLSASMSKSRLNSSQTHAFKESIKRNVDTKPMQSCLVPTPLVVAIDPPHPLPRGKPSVPTKKNLSTQSNVNTSSKEPSPKCNQKPAVPQVTLEVNDVIPPPIKPRDHSVRTPEGPLPRGPLSYDALVHLRRSASTKKTPLCPTIDHTIEEGQHPSITVKDPNLGNQPKCDRAHSEAPKSKTSPPVIAPKPKNLPPKISVKTKNEEIMSSDSASSVKHAADPQVVRLEALQKLGLLKEEQQENETVTTPSPPKSHSSLNPTPNRFIRGPTNVNPSRSPSFCYSQVPSEPKNKTLQSSASFHHNSRHDQQPESASHPAHSDVEHSATPDTDKHGGTCPEPSRITATKPMKTTATAQPEPRKTSNSVKYTAMVVPGMGTDRKEALRKLGLLKE